jgi:hypothetical protein
MMRVVPRVSRSVAGVSVLVLLAGLASACDWSGGSEPSGSPTPSGASTPSVSSGDGPWRRVDVPGTVRSVVPAEDVIVAGEDAGRPVIAKVTRGSARRLPAGGPPSPHDGLAAADFDGESLVVAERPPVDPATPATVWQVDYSQLRDGVPAAWRRDEIRDGTGRAASWLRPLLDGEEDYRAVGAVRLGSRWALHAWMAWDTWRPLDRDEQLYLSGSPEALRTGATETTVVVAGAVSDRPDAPATPQVWSLRDERFEDPDAPGRWTRLPTATTPDAFTDVADWDLGVWVAGHRKLRPVVYDFDSPQGPQGPAGRELPVPDTRLDPRHPVVLVAGTPVTTTMVLATQSVDGPAVWVARDARGSGWTRVAAPPGVLEAAVTVPGGIYLVLDGALWYRPLEIPSNGRG